MITFLILSFIVVSLISGTYSFITVYKINKDLSNNDPWKDNVFTIFLESIMTGVVVGFFSTIIVGIIGIILTNINLL